MLTVLLALTSGSPLSGTGLVVLALVGLVLAVATRTVQVVVVAPVATGRVPRTSGSEPVLRGRVPDPVHHPVSPRAPGLV